MKKLICLFIFLIFGTNNLHAIDERITDFYFGNGVWNDESDAIASQRALEILIRSIGTSASVKLSYNWSSGYLEDLVETFYQMKQEGQISIGSGFFKALVSVAVDNPIYKIFIDLAIETLALSASSEEGANLNNMVANYQNSINDGHKVVLISHSQGNLFGVRAYDRLSSWQKKYFWQVSVASPASRTAKGGGYVTVDNDMVIGPLIEIAGALPANAGNSNTQNDSIHHEFVGEYLSGDATRGAIIGLIQSAYNSAKGAPSQWRVEGNQTCSVNGCEEKIRGVKHLHDSSLNFLMNNLKVYPFQDNGLLYPTTTGYAKSHNPDGHSIFNKIMTNEEGSVCYELRDINEGVLEDIKKEQPCPICKGTTITSGFVEVTVGWGNPNVAIDLDVQFPNGNYDNNDQVCRVEHFYSTSDKGVEEGLYPVYVNYHLLEDVGLGLYEKLSQDVSITIKVPKHIETKTASLAELDWLGGHVADIKVYVGNYTSLSFNSTIFCGSCWGGGVGYWSGGGNSGGKGETNFGSDTHKKYYSPRNPYSVKKNYLYAIIWHLSQAVLGPLSKADVSMYEFKDYYNQALSQYLFQTKTTEGEAIHTAGVIPMTNDLDDDKLYVIEGVEGFDIDADDDGVVDETATTNLGIIRLAMTGYELKNMSFKVNVLTEMIYRLAKDSYDEDNISIYMSKSDDVARCLLKEDINFDNTIDTLDAMSWIPFFGTDELLHHNYTKYYKPIVDKIHNNQDITQEALELYKTPIFLDKKIYFLSNATVGSVIGKAPYVCGNGFNNYKLANSPYFDIDSDGYIILKNTPPDIGVYTVQIIMSNAEGEEAKGVATIHMIHKDAPTLTLNDFIDAIPDTIENGYDLGQAVIVNEGKGALTDIRLEGFGAENFDIDKNGYIKIAQYSSIDRSDVAYKMEAVASNEYGQSMPLNIYIGIYDEWELTPKLSNTYINFYDTDTDVDKVIGKLNHRVSPFCQLIDFTLDKNDVFGVQKNGNIYIKSTPVNDNYTIKAYARSMCGNSNSVSLFINKNSRTVGMFDSSNAQDIVVSANKAYIADGEGGLKIADINNPASPTLIGQTATQFASDIALSKDGKKLFLADGVGGFKIIDITNPKTAFVIGSLPTTYAQAVAVSSDDKIAFLADGKGGLKIIDVSDVTFLSIKAEINEYSVYDVAVSSDGKTLFAAAGFGGLKIFDISDLANPLPIGEIETSYAQGVVITGTKAFIADRNGGLKIANIGDLSNLTIIGAVNMYDANKIVLSQDNTKAYVSDSENGLKIVDISDAANPIVIGFIDSLSAYAAALLQDETKIAVANGEGKIEILNIENTSKTPIIFPATFRVDENSLPETVVGKLTINDDFSKIISVELIGEDYEKFKINNSGIIVVADNANLDYETKKSYSLYAVAYNEFGVSNNANIIINLNNLPDMKPTVSGGEFSVDENAVSETIVGYLDIDSEDSPITLIILKGEGDNNFKVYNNGMIVVANNANIDYETVSYYELLVTVYNEFGSDSSNIYIYVNDIQDSPPFISYNSFTVNENAASGTYVGKIDIESQESVTSIYIKGEGSDNFNIKSDGTILVSENADLDYENTPHYAIKVFAVNKYGVGVGTIFIDLNDMPDSPPFVFDTIIHVDKQASSSDFFGEIQINNDGSGIDNFYLSGEGSENFKLVAPLNLCDRDCYFPITLSNSANLNSLTDEINKIYAVASNKFGSSNGTIWLVTKDFEASPPMFDNITFITFKDGIEQEEYIGIIAPRSNTDCLLTDYTLSDNQKFSAEIYNNKIYLIANQDILENTVLSLDLYANSTCGVSNSAHIVIDTKNRIESFELPSDYSQSKLALADNEEKALIINYDIDSSFVVDLKNSANSRFIDFGINKNMYSTPIIKISSDYKYLYMVSQGHKANELRVYDITDLFNPALKSVTILDSTEMYGLDMMLSEDNKNLFLKDYDYLSVINVSNPNAPVISSAIWLNYAYEIYISKDEKTIYIPSENRAGIINRYYISDPASPVKLNPIRLAGINNIIDTSYDNKILYGAGDYGILTYDIADTNNPKLIAIYDNGEFGFDYYYDRLIRLNNDKLLIYNKTGDNPFSIYDFSNPARIYQSVGMAYDKYPFSAYYNDFTVTADKSKAFISDGNNLLRLNIENIDK
jgi:hypothetical protein